MLFLNKVTSTEEGLSLAKSSPSSHTFSTGISSFTSGIENVFVTVNVASFLDDPVTSSILPLNSIPWIFTIESSSIVDS